MRPRQIRARRLRPAGSVSNQPVRTGMRGIGSKIVKVEHTETAVPNGSHSNWCRWTRIFVAGGFAEAMLACLRYHGDG